MHDVKVVDLNGIVAETEKMLRRLIGEDIRLETLLDSRISPVRVDPGHMGQVLINWPSTPAMQCRKAARCSSRRR